jgi:hypothetical protein
MKIVKRNTDVNIEFINNGIVIAVSGRDVDDNYANEKIYITDIRSAVEFLEALELMPEA